jgi:hypothetical protein
LGKQPPVPPPTTTESKGLMSRPDRCSGRGSQTEGRALALLAELRAAHRSSPRPGHSLGCGAPRTTTRSATNVYTTERVHGRSSAHHLLPHRPLAGPGLLSGVTTVSNSRLSDVHNVQMRTMKMSVTSFRRFRGHRNDLRALYIICRRPDEPASHHRHASCEVKLRTNALLNRCCEFRRDTESCTIRQQASTTVHIHDELGQGQDTSRLIIRPPAD